MQTEEESVTRFRTSAQVTKDQSLDQPIVTQPVLLSKSDSDSGISDNEVFHSAETVCQALAKDWIELKVFAIFNYLVSIPDT